MTQYIVSGIFQGSIYSLIAVGIVVIFKATRVFNFAQGHLLMVGVLLSYVLIGKLGIWIAIPLTIACGIAIGYLLERLTLRPLIGQSITSALLMTLALAYLLDGIATIFWGTKIVPYPQWYPEQFFPLGPINVSSGIVWSIVMTTVVFIALAFFLQPKQNGKEDEGYCRQSPNQSEPGDKGDQGLQPMLDNGGGNWLYHGFLFRGSRWRLPLSFRVGV